MKKLLSGITAMMLVIGLFTTGVQAKEQPKEKTMTYEQVVQMVEEADRKIYKEIENATVEANDLVEWYQTMLSVVPKSKDTDLSIQHLEVVKGELNMLAQVYGIDSSNRTVATSIENLTGKIDSLKVNIDYSYAADAYTNLINKFFNRRLDQIIERLINNTNKIAQDAIRRAAQNGYVVESTWIEVEIGGRVVLVDPCRVDGF